MMALRSQHGTVEPAGTRPNHGTQARRMPTGSRVMNTASSRPSAVPVHPWASGLPISQSCSGSAQVMRKCCQSCEEEDQKKSPSAVQAKLVVGQADDPLETQADRTADQVMRMPDPGISVTPTRPQLSRKCDGCADEERDKESRLQTKRSGRAHGGDAAPPSVHAVLARSGHPLEPATRGFLESRFGHSFGDVRIHDDPAAARSAASLGARAYTVGRSIVFGSGQYQPSTPGGQWLLAHELTHTVQQGGDTGTLSRACLGPDVCDAPKAKEGSQDKFVQNTKNTPQQKTKDEKRKDACGKAPPDPTCTGDGHGKRATETEAFLNTASRGRLSAVFGVFVDMDMPDGWAGNTIRCDSEVPPIPGGAGKSCTFVHDKTEKEAAQYNSGANTIGGNDRRSWSELTLRLLTHETEHALFGTASAAGTEVKDPAIACDFDANRSSLTELAAIISEFKPVLHKTQALPESQRQGHLDWWFNFWIATGGENISGNLRAMRCKCDCAPVNAYIQKMFDFASKGWNSYEKHLYNTTLADPKWGLDWPVKPPAAVDVNDLPSTGTSTDIEDLPSAK